jgi:hypothetical protein
MKRWFVLAAATVSLVVLLASIAFGLTSTGHGGTPTDVFTATNPGVCAEVDGFGGPVIQTEITVSQTSNLSVFYTFEWGTLDPHLEGLVDIGLLDRQTEQVIAGQGEWGFSSGNIPRQSGTVTWSFTSIPPGNYWVVGAARVDATPTGVPGGGQAGSAISAGLNECSLTVLVSPTVA